MSAKHLARLALLTVTLSACQTTQAPHQPATNWMQFEENCVARHRSAEACVCVTRSLSNSMGFQQYQDLAFAWMRKLPMSKSTPNPADGAVKRTGIPLDRPQEQSQSLDDPFLRLNAQAAKTCQTTILDAMGRQ